MITLSDGVMFVEAILRHGKASISCKRTLVDTGSAVTVFRADILEGIGCIQQPSDRIRRMRGIGGHEFVIELQIDSVQVGDLGIADFTVQSGAIQYGIELDGIIGLDFLLATKAIIDLNSLELRAGASTL